MRDPGYETKASYLNAGPATAGVKYPTSGTQKIRRRCGGKLLQCHILGLTASVIVIMQ